MQQNIKNNNKNSNNIDNSSLNANKQKLNFKQNFIKYKKLYKVISYIFILIMLFISLFRIPYLGQFLDSVLFSFVFGYSKYIIYLYLIFYCILNIFNIKYKPLYSKRLLLASFICACLISMLLSGISILTFSQHSIKYYVINIWYNQLFDFNKWFLFGFSDYIDSGIIGAIIASIPGVFIIVLSLILLTILYFFIFKNHRKKMIKKMFKYWSKKYDVNLDKINNIEKNNKETEILSSKKQSAFNLNDNYIKNDINIKELVNELTINLKQNNFLFSEINIKENEKEYIINFDIDDEQINLFEAKKSFIDNIFKNQDYSLYIIENSIYIKLLKISNIINNTIKKYLDIRINKNNEYALCFNNNYEPVYSSLNTNNVIGLMINKEQNYYEYLNALSAHLSINYNKEFLEINYLLCQDQENKILNSENVSQVKINNIVLINKFLNLLEQNMYEIEKLFKQYNVNSLDELNKKQNHIFKKRFIILDSISKIIEQDNECLFLLKKIIKKAYRYNIVFLLIDNSKNIISKNDINYDLIMNFNYYFKANDNDILYDLNNKNKTNIILPKIRNKELNIIQNKLLSIKQNSNQ